MLWLLLYGQRTYLYYIALGRIKFKLQQMNLQERNWYIQYDYKTFNIINDPKFKVLIFKAVEQFSQVEGPQNQQQQQQIPTPPWIVEIAQSIMQILILLYNFFNVEYKLSKNQSVKARFNTICSVLKIENEYCRYFFVMSVEFRVNRILACLLRLNRFMECIVEFLSELKKHMDQTLLDNLNEVYLFMQQRIRQTLQVTRTQGDHDLNIILLDMISLLLRNSGDPTMKGILDTNRQKVIIDSILKSNEIYDEFMIKKIEARKIFEQNKQFIIKGQDEQDPTTKKHEQQNENEY